MDEQLSRKFWSIILASWSIEEIDNLDGYARLVEDSMSWRRVDR